MKKIIAIFIFSVVLAGCTTNKQKIVYDYIYSNTSNQSEESQLQIDKGACLQRSYAVSIPDAPNLDGISGFAKGYLTSQYYKQKSQAEADKQQIFDGCMLEKGYQKIVTNNHE